MCKVTQPCSFNLTGCCLVKKEDIWVHSNYSFAREIKWKGQMVKEIYITAHQVCVMQDSKMAPKIPTPGVLVIMLHYGAKIKGF